MPAKAKKRNRKLEVGIIGYGRMGKVIAHYLKKHFTVYVFDNNKSIKIERGLIYSSLKDTLKKRIIIFAVPINRFKLLLKKISPYLSPETLVIDCCSVKEQPVQWMKKILPKEIHILGTHPLFGPSSARKDLIDLSIILCPVRISRTKLNSIKRYLTSAGLKIKIMSPAKHDQLIASTLFITQFIGRGIYPLKISNSEIATPNYNFLMSITRSSQADSIELFKDIFRYNRYARKMPYKIIRNFEKLSAVLSESCKKSAL